MRRIGTALAVLLFAANASFAHYNMLLPDKPWANKDEKVTFTYQFGHPYEHELFDAPKPVALVVITPKGKKEVLDIDKTLAPIKKDGADGKKVTAWQFTFIPPERGDYTFVLQTAKIKHEEDKFIEDNVKVVLHVQTQNGWDTTLAPFGSGIDIHPYTRPYGLLPGMAFRGRVVWLPLKGAIKQGSLPVEIEKYNPRPMKQLPPDELITFKTKADTDGFFVTTLPEPGWWGVTALAQGSQRATIWIHVDEKKMTLFAVHISDGVLTAPWLLAGFAFAAFLLLLAAWRIRDDEIPRIAILTAAFFVSSMIHIRVGPTSIHLLLTGLVGVLLGRRAALAIAVGLLLQMMLIGHGGWTTLGINTCVMTLPALLCWLLFQTLHRLPWITKPAARCAFVGVSAFVLFMSAVFSVTLLVNTPLDQLDWATLETAGQCLLHPWTIEGAIVFVLGAIVLEGRLENTPEFPLGFLIGELAVLLTVGLNCVTLIAGGEKEWPIMPLLLVIAHLPFAVVEGVILGCVLGYLARVKPEMLASFSRDPEGSAESVPLVHAASNPRSPSGRG